MKNILSSNPPPIPNHYSGDLKTVISLLLEKNPNIRSSVHELFETEFVSSKLKVFLFKKELDKKNQTILTPTNSKGTIIRQTNESIPYDNGTQKDIRKMKIPRNPKPNKLLIDTEEPESNAKNLPSSKSNPFEANIPIESRALKVTI